MRSVVASGLKAHKVAAENRASSEALNRRRSGTISGVGAINTAARAGTGTGSILASWRTLGCGNYAPHLASFQFPTGRVSGVPEGSAIILDRIPSGKREVTETRLLKCGM